VLIERDMLAVDVHDRIEGGFFERPRLTLAQDLLRLPAFDFELPLAEIYRERDRPDFMIEVSFYHLTRRKLEQALPVLLEKSLARGWRVAVQARDAKRLQNLDDFLWSFEPTKFLPHGTKSDGAPETQPIYLTIEGDNPNAADVRFLIDGVTPRRC